MAVVSSAISRPNPELHFEKIHFIHVIIIFIYDLNINYCYLSIINQFSKSK